MILNFIYKFCNITSCIIYINQTLFKVFVQAKPNALTLLQSLIKNFLSQWYLYICDVIFVLFSIMVSLRSSCDFIVFSYWVLLSIHICIWNVKTDLIEMELGRCFILILLGICRFGSYIDVLQLQLLILLGQSLVVESLVLNCTLW